MAKADRLARLDDRRVALEEEYTEALVAALRKTASGKWGLFDHKGDRAMRAAFAPVVGTLTEVGEAIDEARATLGMPAFDLHQQFLASRGPVGPQAVGEPKQAEAWLSRMVGPLAAKP